MSTNCGSATCGRDVAFRKIRALTLAVRKVRRRLGYNARGGQSRASPAGHSIRSTDRKRREHHWPSSGNTPRYRLRPSPSRSVAIGGTMPASPAPRPPGVADLEFAAWIRPGGPDRRPGGHLRRGKADDQVVASSSLPPPPIPAARYLPPGCLRTRCGCARRRRRRRSTRSAGWPSWARRSRYGAWSRWSPPERRSAGRARMRRRDHGLRGRADVIVDVGVAGLHRLVAQADRVAAPTPWWRWPASRPRCLRSSAASCAPLVAVPTAWATAGTSMGWRPGWPASTAVLPGAHR